MIISVFGDESHDETRQRVFSVSGVYGTNYEWMLTEREWVRRLEGKEFHAADFEHEGQHDLYKDLVQIVAKGRLGAVCASLDLAAFREYYPQETLSDTAYLKCMTDVIKALAEMNRYYNSNPEHAHNLATLEFTFDHRKAGEGTAGTLYETLLNLPEWADAGPFDTKISFDCRTNPRIQIADLLAREAMKELDRKITGKPKNQRRSIAALKQCGNRFRFDEFDREWVRIWHSQIPAMQAERGNLSSDYLEWLKLTKRVQNGKPHDNWKNRFQYLALFEDRFNPPLPKENRKPKDENQS